jgi:hypothetical protein
MTGSPQNNAYLNKQRKMTQIRLFMLSFIDPAILLSMFMLSFIDPAVLLSMFLLSFIDPAIVLSMFMLSFIDPAILLSMFMLSTNNRLSSYLTENKNKKDHNI